jgi:hypothetical protein
MCLSGKRLLSNDQWAVLESLINECRPQGKTISGQIFALWVALEGWHLRVSNKTRFRWEDGGLCSVYHS